MPEPRSIAWRLTPEQLIAACEALGIVALPHSRFVHEHEGAALFVRDAGSRALVACRLAEPAGATLRVEPTLGAALLSLTGVRPDAIAMLVEPGGRRRALVAHDGRATTLVETDDIVELIVEPLAQAVRRLDALIAGSLSGLPEVTVSAATPEVTTESVRRWQAVAAGGRVRRTDDPLLARAARAALGAGGVWEAGVVLSDARGRLRGEQLGWTIDGAGAVIIEPDVEAIADDDAVVLRTGPGIVDEIRAIWTLLRGIDPSGADTAWSAAPATV
jgi:hypothetical protein